MKHKILIFIMIIIPALSIAQGRIEGKVMISGEGGAPDNSGLPGANVVWSGTTTGASTNAAGYFSLKKIKGNELLVASFVGYTPDTVIVAPGDDYIEIFLTENSLLGEITVIGRATGAHLDRSAPIATVKITGAELCKAACCNLSESFVTNASVDVNYADAATGAKQIQLLGLAGSYVQILAENIPSMYGLGAAYGLSYIPGPWMESIQVSKGTSSVRNGNESITGQINVEYKKPATSDKIFVNGFVSDAGKFESNADASVRLNELWSTMILAHAETQSGASDHNNDGFRDEPDVRQYSFMNRWDYLSNNLTFRAGIKYLKEERIGGQFSYDRNDANTWDNGYGITIGTERTEAFTKLGGLFGPEDKMSLGWIQSMAYHDMNSWMGFNTYDATQKSYYTNLLYQYFPAEKHTIDAGASYRYDHYDEMRGVYESSAGLVATDLAGETIESVPGVFLQYTYTDSAKVTLLAGVRYDFYRNHGAQFTPRIHLRYEITPKMTLRASAGKGFRTVHVMAENMFYLASSRAIVIANDLDIEEAWNAGINLTGYIPLGDRELRISGEAYRTSFIKQIVTDLDSSVDQVLFYNLDGKSWSNVFQLEAQLQPLTGLDITAAWRWNDVWQTIGGELREKPLSSRYKGLLTASYTTRMKKWQVDYTLQYNGPGRIPSTMTNPEPYRRDDYFSAYPVMNAQLTKYFRKWSVYIGAENITGSRQHDAIIAADDPFSQYFDSGMIWGPVHGRKLYAGFRFALERDQN
ncbi:MAG: TonB-dependent receptor [Bacteroidales bacterium]|jgi:outer membrane receptor for ferrienterochelin and colicin|nr:TonB-dependent receptor [Bacteroidales bacterium]